MIKSFKDSDLWLMLQNTAIMTCYLSSYVFPTNVQFEMMVMVWERGERTLREVIDK